VTLALSATGAGAAGGGKVAYNSIPKNLPGNVPSQPFQAQQVNEFGDSVLLERAGGKAKSVDVVMSSWACESGAWYTLNCASSKNATFRHPITLSLYAATATGEPGALLVTDTQTFAIPYRPSADPRCVLADAGKWYSKADDACYNGFAHEITFKLNDKVALPEAVVWTVAFDTSGYGPSPRGYATACATSPEGCPYDSLNVGTESFEGQPSSGTDTHEDGAVINSSNPATYCVPGTPNVLRVDRPCWTGFRPLATIRTTGGDHSED
jgi:hypothetical protein